MGAGGSPHRVENEPRSGPWALWPHMFGKRTHHHCVCTEIYLCVAPCKAYDICMSTHILYRSMRDTRLSVIAFECSLRSICNASISALIVTACFLEPRDTSIVELLAG